MIDSMVMWLFNMHYSVLTYRMFRSSGFFCVTVQRMSWSHLSAWHNKGVTACGWWYTIHRGSCFTTTSNTLFLVIVLLYTGQTDRQFKTKFKEHALAYKKKKSNPAYAKLWINHGHSLDHMEGIMSVIRVFTTNKGKHLDTVEK